MKSNSYSRRIATTSTVLYGVVTVPDSTLNSMLLLLSFIYDTLLKLEKEPDQVYNILTHCDFSQATVISQCANN